MTIRIIGEWFKDEYGRTLILRGVNLGGSTKVPYTPDGATYISEGFFDHKKVSFVGRPFPLEEADEHFARLREWGFTFLRFLVTWEALEHEGPGIYDEAYIDYVSTVVEKANDYGIDLFIDPHQDVWSRFSGGDGAPGWTFEVVGLDITKFSQTGAAIVHQIHGDPFPRMIWPTNGEKLAAATMFTLFFAGNDFAPETKVNGEPVQDYLQRHYVNAIVKLAERLKEFPNVIGYDTMNEPSSGFIGLEDLSRLSGLLRLGEMPTPYQSMLLGSGHPQEVDLWQVWLGGVRRVGKKWINEDGERAWLPGHDCVWQQNGVWGYDKGGKSELLRPNHFLQVDGREVSFVDDYYKPFANRYAEEIRSVDTESLIFIESVPSGEAPVWGTEDARDIVWAPHWYDGLVLVLKRYRSFIAVDMEDGSLVIGAGKIRDSFRSQVGRLKAMALENLGGVPTLIGEFGIPFDMKGKKAYRTSDFSEQQAALDRSFKPMEDHLLSCTLWNYTSDNTNLHGDQWNDEDLSIFSRDQQVHPDDTHSGGRALEAAVRPYAAKTAGVPHRMSFELKSRIFE
ncbi:MAG: cellulase family glycosylhydrolase, partial [Anaerolineales bacterium]|nr:cellulase family glycosylhydrolase [Anaerolineales bacterium]